MKPKLLCLDDDPHILEALTRALKNDFQVLSATRGADALDLAAKNRDCAIVLTDYQMPELNGIEFLKKVRRLLPTSARAILSGQIDLNLVSQALNDGDIHKFFLKPWENNYLKLQMLEALHLQSALQRAATDPVTHLPNHRFFQEQLELEFQSAMVHGRSLGLIMLDVDHFKSFNDRFGHPQGDKLLMSLAQRIREASLGSGIACRYGGEEFAVIFPNTETQKLYLFADRLREIIEKTPVLGLSYSPSYVTASLGLACCPAHAKTKVDLIAAADRALYQAKRQGRNQTVIASIKD